MAEILSISIGKNDLNGFDELSYAERHIAQREQYLKAKEMFPNSTVTFRNTTARTLMLPPVNPEVTEQAIKMLEHYTVGEKAALLDQLLYDSSVKRECELTYGRLIDLWEYDDFVEYWGKAHDEEAPDDFGDVRFHKEISAEDWEQLIALHHKTFDSEQGINWYRIEHLCEYVKERNDRENKK